MTPSKILFYLSISFIVGIFINSMFSVPQNLSWAFLLFGFLMIIISSFLKKYYLILIGFCLLFALLGSLRVDIAKFNISNNELKSFNDNGEIALVGVISNEPDLRDKYQKFKVDIQNPKGVILVSASRYPDYQYLDKIQITGKLETPSETEDFSYKNYLLKDGIYSVMGFPKIELLGKGDKTFLSNIYSSILWFKQKLRESIRKNYSPPQSLILEGTVLGDNGVMSQELKDKLNITGLRHVIAVSGTHVVILGAILMSLLLALGLWRGQAFYVSIVFIWLYIILTGLSAAGVRAGIMGSLFLLAQKLGRQSNGPRIITIAGALMLIQNPLLLIYDVGFQLSFLASMGIMSLDPFIKGFLTIFTKGKFENLLGIISTTFAAQIFTLPIMLYNFGNISLIAPVTNLLVLPIVSGLMIFGFLSSILGVFSSFVGWIFSIPCWFLLTYFIKVIDAFSKPYFIKVIQNVHWIWLIVLYLLISLSVYFLKKWEIKNRWV